jgi:hypothetical protein
MTFTTTRSTITTTRPALETAAAVKLPDIAEAIVRPASTSIMINRTTIPRGVLMIAIIEADSLGFKCKTSSRTEKDLGISHWINR